LNSRPQRVEEVPYAVKMLALATALAVGWCPGAESSLSIHAA